MSHSYEVYAESISRTNEPPPPVLTTSGVQPTAADKQRRTAQDQESRTEDASEELLADFTVLGIRKSVRVTLHEAFPGIRTPTACQTAFIPAVLDRKDVILKDWTGTGKSFGLVLALLSKARATRPHLSYKERTARAKRPITSMVVVPHRDLAYQLMHWIRMLCPHNHQDSLDSIAQVCVRGGSAPPLAQQVAKLHEQAPHILIGTPNALVDILESDRAVLQIDTLETVVVDEVDYLLPVPAPSEGKKKHWNWTAHPPPTLRLLNALFKDRSKIKREESARPWRWPLQTVLASATLRPHLRRFLFSETTWMDRYSQVVKIDFRQEAARIGLGGVGHFALVVDEAGAMRNLKFEEKESAEVSGNRPSSAKRIADNTEKVMGSTFLEAVATTFALDVPKIALLVLPASASVTNVVKELQDVGVRARSLALHDDDGGKNEIIKSKMRKFNRGPRIETEAGAAEEPSMLVATEASIRGLDLPELTHVFIIGVPESQIEYNHAAGRVGRFGRAGKVVVFLDATGKHSMVRVSRWTKSEWIDEEERLRRLYAALGISPSTFEHVSF